MSWYIGLGRTSCENETWSSRRSSRPYGTVRVPDMDPPPSSALSLFILVLYIMRKIMMAVPVPYPVLYNPFMCPKEDAAGVPAALATVPYRTVQYSYCCLPPPPDHYSTRTSTRTVLYRTCTRTADRHPARRYCRRQQPQPVQHRAVHHGYRYCSRYSTVSIPPLGFIGRRYCCRRAPAVR